jgi:hypothetical protein
MTPRPFCVLDFVHARTAEACGAERIVTLNLRDYGMMTDLPLEVPVKP